MRTERNEFDIKSIENALKYGVKSELLDNTFAEGCYNWNSIEELLEPFYLKKQNYQADIKNWPELKTKSDWLTSITQALLHKLWYAHVDDAGETITLSVSEFAVLLYGLGVYINYTDVRDE